MFKTLEMMENSLMEIIPGNGEVVATAKDGSEYLSDILLAMSDEVYTAFYEKAMELAEEDPNILGEQTWLNWITGLWAGDLNAWLKGAELYLRAMVPQSTRKQRETYLAMGMYTWEHMGNVYFSFHTPLWEEVSAAAAA